MVIRGEAEELARYAAKIRGVKGFGKGFSAHWGLGERFEDCAMGSFFFFVVVFFFYVFFGYVFLSFLVVLRRND